MVMSANDGNLQNMKRNEGESAIAFSDRLYKENREAGVETLRPETRKALLLLVKEKNYRRILEIGTAEGATAVALLAAFPAVTMVTIEADEGRFLTAKENLEQAGVTARVRQIFGRTEEVLPVLSQPFDLILLDGPKGSYAEFYGECKRLLAPCGTLFADDVSFHGYVTGETPYRRKHGAIIRSLRTFLDTAQQDEAVTCEVFPVEDGFAVITKKR